MFVKSILSSKPISYPKVTVIALTFIVNSLKRRISPETQFTTNEVPTEDQLYFAFLKYVAMLWSVKVYVEFER